jgi:hypothetical protein
MQLEQKTQEEYDLVGEKLVGLLNERNYKEAKIIYKSLKEEAVGYLAGHKEYRWTVRAIKCSCI